MPKARKSTRNSDAMDAEGHEEVRDVFVVFTTSSRFLIFFSSLSVSFYALSLEEVNSSNSFNSIFNSTVARILTESLCLSLFLSLFVTLATTTTMSSWKR